MNEREPWELREEDDRTADGLILYLIFCEDEVSEVLYFESFTEPADVKINVIGDFKSKYKHVSKVIAHCQSNAYMTDKNGVLYLDHSQVKVWCVFDNDIFNEKAAQEPLDFRLSVEMAEKYGLKVAWSNDAFELWILLHFEDADLNEEKHRRSYYYEALTRIFEDAARRSEFLGAHLENKPFDYKHYIKKGRAFREIALPMIKPNTAIAIKRAKDLYQKHLSQGKLSCDQHLPGTVIFELVEELLNLSI